MNLSPTELDALLKTLTPQQKLEFIEELEEQEKRLRLKQAQNSLTAFAHKVYPGFKEGPHHRKLAKIFADVASGKSAFKKGEILFGKRVGE